MAERVQRLAQRVAEAVADDQQRRATLEQPGADSRQPGCESRLRKTLPGLGGKIEQDQPVAHVARAIQLGLQAFQHCGEVPRCQGQDQQLGRTCVSR